MAFVQEDVRDRILLRFGISRFIPAPITKALIRLGAGTTVLPAIGLSRLFESKLELGMESLFTSKASLKDLIGHPANPGNIKPELAVNTSVLENGKPLFFTTNPDSPLTGENKRNHQADQEDLSQLTLARMVAASACVPGIFNPIDISVGEQALHCVDGGVLDNLGGHAIQLLGQDSMLVMISDASKPLQTVQNDSNFVQSFFRIQDIFMDTIRGLRLDGGSGVTVQIRDTPRGIDERVKDLVVGMRTDLNSFSEIESYSLMYYGYCACGEQVPELRERLGEQAEAAAGKEKEWEFLKIRALMETPTPDYLSKMGQKEKPLLPIPKISVFTILSCCYLVLFLSLFYYIGVSDGFAKAFWYIVFIPVTVSFLGGTALLQLKIRRSKKNGSIASLK
jgi:predicted acylesterase/phospholipase RssA